MNFLLIAFLAAMANASFAIEELHNLDGKLLCNYYYLGQHRGLIADKNHLKLYVDPIDIGVIAHLITKCEWEPEETRLVNYLIRPHQKWVEVGANFGYYTLMIGEKLRDGPGKLFAFEGSPRFMKYIVDSVSVGGLKNSIELFNYAVFKESGHKITF